MNERCCSVTYGVVVVVRLRYVSPSFLRLLLLFFFFFIDGKVISVNSTRNIVDTPENKSITTATSLPVLPIFSFRFHPTICDKYQNVKILCAAWGLIGNETKIYLHNFSTNFNFQWMDSSSSSPLSHSAVLCIWVFVCVRCAHTELVAISYNSIISHRSFIPCPIS